MNKIEKKDGLDIQHQGGFITDFDEERNQIIKELIKYKISLEKSEGNLLKKLYKHYNQEDVTTNQEKCIYKIKTGLKDLKNLNYAHPYETYLKAQIKIAEFLPPILGEHISMLEDGEKENVVLESLEYEVYKVKRDLYTGLNEWKTLLKHIPKDRLSRIEQNPKGPGDHLIKELSWINSYEEKIKKKDDRLIRNL